jgi:hypothetical protein
LLGGEWGGSNVHDDGNGSLTGQNGLVMMDGGMKMGLGMGYLLFVRFGQVAGCSVAAVVR